MTQLANNLRKTCQSVDYWQPVRDVIFFKRDVYRQALQQLGPIAFPEGLAPPPPESPDASG